MKFKILKLNFLAINCAQENHRQYNSEEQLDYAEYNEMAYPISTYNVIGYH